MVFNPHPNIDVVTIADGHRCYVIDDAVMEPDQLVNYAIARRDAFTMAPFNAYPGLEFYLPQQLSVQLDDLFRCHVRRLLGARRTLQMYSRLSMVTLPPEKLLPIQWLCHRDRMNVPPNQCAAASVLYLFKDESLGGTSFFMPKRSPEKTEALMAFAATAMPEEFAAQTGVLPGYLTESNDHFERVCTIPARWNRMIFYEGSLFHTPDIRSPEKLSADPEKGRLTLNGFYTCSKAAS